MRGGQVSPEAELDRGQDDRRVGYYLSADLLPTTGPCRAPTCRGRVALPNQQGAAERRVRREGHGGCWPRVESKVTLVRLHVKKKMCREVPFSAGTSPDIIFRISLRQPGLSSASGEVHFVSPRRQGMSGETQVCYRRVTAVTRS